MISIVEHQATTVENGLKMRIKRKSTTTSEHILMNMDEQEKNCSTTTTTKLLHDDLVEGEKTECTEDQESVEITSSKHRKKSKKTGIHSGPKSRRCSRNAKELSTNSVSFGSENEKTEESENGANCGCTIEEDTGKTELKSETKNSSNSSHDSIPSSLDDKQFSDNKRSLELKLHSLTLVVETNKKKMINSKEISNIALNSENVDGDGSAAAAAGNGRTDAGTETVETAVMTDPDFLGPCEPGTSVVLEGIVWNESNNGILVVNVTWRGKTYVGTLMDSTVHHWAPPRFRNESPQEEVPKNRRSTSNCTLPEIVGGGRRLRKCRKDAAAAAKKSSSTRLNFPSTEQPSSSSLLQNHHQFLCRTRHEETSAKKSLTVVTSDNISSSDIFYECQEPNCKKKYRHINGLRYHQSHSHRRQIPNSTTTGSNCQHLFIGSGDQKEVLSVTSPPPPSESLEGKACKDLPDVLDSSLECDLDGKDSTTNDDQENPCTIKRRNTLLEDHLSKKFRSDVDTNLIAAQLQTTTFNERDVESYSVDSTVNCTLDSVETVTYVLNVENDRRLIEKDDDNLKSENEKYTTEQTLIERNVEEEELDADSENSKLTDKVHLCSSLSTDVVANCLSISHDDDDIVLSSLSPCLSVTPVVSSMTFDSSLENKHPVVVFMEHKESVSFSEKVETSNICRCEEKKSIHQENDSENKKKIIPVSCCSSSSEKLHQNNSKNKTPPPSTRCCVDVDSTSPAYSDISDTMDEEDSIDDKNKQGRNSNRGHGDLIKDIVRERDTKKSGHRDPLKLSQKFDFSENSCEMKECKDYVAKKNLADSDIDMPKSKDFCSDSDLFDRLSTCRDINVISDKGQQSHFKPTEKKKKEEEKLGNEMNGENSFPSFSDQHSFTCSKSSLTCTRCDEATDQEHHQRMEIADLKMISKDNHLPSSSQQNRNSSEEPVDMSSKETRKRLNSCVDCTDKCLNAPLATNIDDNNKEESIKLIDSSDHNNCKEDNGSNFVGPGSKEMGPGSKEMGQPQLKNEPLDQHRLWPSSEFVLKSESFKQSFNKNSEKRHPSNLLFPSSNKRSAEGRVITSSSSSSESNSMTSCPGKSKHCTGEISPQQRSLSASKYLQVFSDSFSTLPNNCDKTQINNPHNPHSNVLSHYSSLCCPSYSSKNRADNTLNQSSPCDLRPRSFYSSNNNRTTTIQQDRRISSDFFGVKGRLSEDVLKQQQQRLESPFQKSNWTNRWNPEGQKTLEDEESTRTQIKENHQASKGHEQKWENNKQGSSVRRQMVAASHPPSQSPPTKRHLHTHHHTHIINASYPSIYGQYAAASLLSASSLVPAVVIPDIYNPK